MFSILPDNPDLSCPSCHRPMIAMREYYKTVQAGSPLETESPLLLRGGRYATLNPFAVAEFFSNIIDVILNGFRHKKGVQLCREILPRYPKSQICVECLYVHRRV